MWWQRLLSHLKLEKGVMRMVGRWLWWWRWRLLDDGSGGDVAVKVVRLRWYGYIKNHKKTVKNRQARTRESVEYKAEARKVKPQSKSAKKSQKGTKDNLGVQVHLGSKKRHSPSLIGPIPKEECHVVERKAQVKKKIALVSLTKLAQHVISKNDSLAILECTQFDQTTTIEAPMIKRFDGQD
ncbi:hypothetical protein Tco_1359020 [Tanacetum coccineum]